MFKKIICLILVLSMLFLVSSCAIENTVGSTYYKSNESSTNTESTNESDTQSESLSNTETDSYTQTETEDETTVEEIEQLGESFFLLSSSHEDYIGDIETFVYGLLTHTLSYSYDVFPATVQLSDGYSVCGLAFTDYSEAYTDDDETQSYIMSGFLPFVGELDIPQEDFDSGLYIYSREASPENMNFVWKYKSEAFLDHCVVYGAYLQYGVASNGKITYDAVPYTREACDTTLGALYSYDDSRYLCETDFGEYIPITGESLAITFDFAEFEKELNAILEEQNANFMTYDMKSIAYTSKETMVSFFLSLQEETFLGYSVDTLIEITRNLDPLECLRVTSDGLTVIDIQEHPPAEPSALCKWLVGVSCGIVIAVGMVVSVAATLCPPISALAGSATGTAMEIFSQVIIENTALENLSWSKIGIAAVSGAVSGLVGPYLQAYLNGAGYFIVDSVFDGIIGATEQFAYALIDGESFEDSLAKMGSGFLLGAGISAGFKVAGKVISKVGNKVSDKITKVATKISPKLESASSKFSKTLTNVKNAVGDRINVLKKKFDSSIFYSERLAKKAREKVLTNLNKAQRDAAFELSFGKGTADAKKVMDANGNYFTRETLKKTALNAKNGDIIGYIEVDGVRCPIKKDLNFYSLDMRDKYPTVSAHKYSSLETSAKKIREERLAVARKDFRDYFLENSNEIPDEIRKAIKSKYPDKSIEESIKSMSDTAWEKTLGASHALHENIDGTVTLIPKNIHKAISHIGGASVESFAKQHMGSYYFETFVQAAANGAVIGVQPHESKN